MQFLLDDEMRARYKHRIKTIRWLGFNHDTSQQYPVVPLDQYPLSRGWSEESLKELRSVKKPLEDPRALAMLQSWFFFGLIEAIFDRHISTKDYIVGSPEGLLVDTTKLRNILIEYRPFLEAGKEPENQASFRNHQRAKHESLTLSVHWNRVFYNMQEKCVPSLKDDLHHVLCLTAFCADAIFHTDYWTEFEFRNPDDIGWLTGSDQDTDVMHRMRTVGWCPSVFHQLNSVCFCVLEMASIFGPSDPPDPILIHDECTKDECQYENVDIKSWKPKHVPSTCTCTNLRAPIEQVNEVLRKENFGLVNIDLVLDENSGGNNMFVPYTSGTKYIAFSHVWSQGLGSTAEEGLPKCQLHRLREFILQCSVESEEGSSQAPRLFWIDSLCVPQEHTLKNKAIAQMATIYRKSAATLVLDTSLQAVQRDRALFSSPSAQNKLLIQIVASAWNRRLWTYQEGTLASTVRFMLLDGPVSGGAIINSIRSKKDRIANPITSRLQGQISPILWAIQRAIGLGSVARTMSERTTSHASDEIPAIASLLNIDVGPLLAFDDEKRMSRFLLAVRNVPSDVVFHGATKLKVENFRWAPRTFLRSKTHTWSRDAMSTRPRDATATVTEMGLRGRFLLALLSPSVTIIHRFYGFLDEKSKKWYGFVLRSIPEPPESVECAAIAFPRLPTSRLDYVRGVALSSSGVAASGEPILRYEHPLVILQANEEMDIKPYETTRHLLSVKEITTIPAIIT